MNYESASEWVPNPGDPTRRAHGPLCPGEARRIWGPPTFIPLLTQGGRQEPGSIRPPNKSYPSTWIPLPLPCCTAAWEIRPFWNGLSRPGPHQIQMEAPVSYGKEALCRTPFLWPVFLYKWGESWHIATPFLPGELTQEAAKGHVQLLGMLPVTTTWQHSWEDNKTSCVIMPYGPVQSLYLLLPSNKTILPGWHFSPTPVVQLWGRPFGCPQWLFFL